MRRVRQCDSQPAKGYSTPGSGAAEFAIVSLSTDTLTDPTVLAHEFGHLLLQSGFHNSAVDGLMHEDRPGTQIAACNDWARDDVSVPFNCHNTLTAESFSCEQMRAQARKLAGEPSTPFEMEPPPSGELMWTYGRPSYGNTSPVTPVNRNDGEGQAIAVPQGYRDISSPVFPTAEVNPIGTEVHVDVYVPAEVPDPWWVGSVAISFENIATSTYAYLGPADLTGLARGAWSTLTFTLSENVRSVLLGDHPGAHFVVTTNVSTEGILVDNFAFGGTFDVRSVYHQSGSLGLDVATNALLSFEAPSQWSTEAPISEESETVSDGALALGVEASGWTVISSVAFSTTELPALSSTLGLDVFIPDPQPNPWWVGEVRLHATCPTAGLFGALIGNVPLQNLFPNEYNHLTFEVPSPVGAALSAPGDCHFDLILNTQNGAGHFLLDRLGFQ